MHPKCENACKEIQAGDCSVLLLSNEHLDDDDAAALAEALQRRDTVSYASLSRNCFGDEGAQTLGVAWQGSRTLEHLDLALNGIGDSGACAVANILQTNVLKHLDLHENHIGDAGALALAEALQLNSSLTMLDLGNNDIGAAGAQALARALQQHGSIQRLDLNWNRIGSDGARALAHALKENESLQHLTITGNKLDRGTVEAFADALPLNNTLQTLRLGNCIHGCSNTMRDALKQNGRLTDLGLTTDGMDASAWVDENRTSVGKEKRKLAAQRIQAYRAANQAAADELARKEQAAADELARKEQAAADELARKEQAVQEAAAAEAAALHEQNAKAREITAETMRRLRVRSILKEMLLQDATHEETQLKAAFTAVSAAQDVLAYLERSPEPGPATLGDETATVACVDHVAELAAGHHQCQSAIVGAEGEEALAAAVLERNAARKELMVAASEAEQESDTLFRLHAALSIHHADLACTLARLRGSSEDEATTADSGMPAEAAKVAEDTEATKAPSFGGAAELSPHALVSLKRLAEEIHCEAEKALKAILGARRRHCRRVEGLARTRTTDGNNNEFDQCMAADADLINQLYRLDCDRLCLSRAAASCHSAAVQELQQRLDEVAKRLTAVRERQHTLGKLLALTDSLALAREPNLTQLQEAEVKERRALRVQAVAEKKLAAAMLEQEVLDEEDADEEAEDVRQKVASRRAALATAEQSRRAASADAHKQAVALLQVAHWFPELLHRCDRLAELQAAGSLTLGRCLEDYLVEATLAGGEGKECRHQVLLCRRKDANEGELCVLKRYTLAGGGAASVAARRRLLREVELLQRARHPFVTEAHAVFFAADGSAAYVELAHYGGGDLSQWLAATPRGETAVVRLLRQAMLGLAAVHAAGVVHGDIKATNLFVAADGGRCVVGDFDVARTADSDGSRAITATVLIGTEAYLAPELLTPGAVATMASDIFALGLVMFDALFPREEGGPERRPSVVARLCGEALAVPAHRHEDVRQLLERMLSLQPEERPSAAEALAHPFFHQAVTEEDIGEGEARLWGLTRVCAVEAKCLERDETAGHLTLAEGLECSERLHYVCAGDLAAYVAAYCSAENGIRQAQTRGIVPCFATGCTGHFPTHDLAQQLPTDAFGVVLAMQQRLLEQEVSREQAELYQQRLGDEVARMAQEGAVGMYKRRIQEELLLLRCPRCQAPFLDFTGCFALQCARCPCEFCAVCLADCGSDAHSHVAQCPERAVRGIFGSAEEFEEAQRKRRSGLVQAFLADLPLDTRAAVVAAVQQDLADLGIVAA